MKTSNPTWGAKRTFIRLMRSYIPTYNSTDYRHLQEHWGLTFLQFHFRNMPKSQKKWMNSPVFWQWVKKGFDSRNIELLNKLGYGIHFSEKVSTEECKKFIAAFQKHHQLAIKKTYPAKPIVFLIQKRDTEKVC